MSSLTSAIGRIVSGAKASRPPAAVAGLNRRPFTSREMRCWIVLAQLLIDLVPAGMAWAWMRGERVARLDLLGRLLSALLALLVVHIWPQSTPFVLHLGTQLIAHADAPGLPSDYVTEFWSRAMSALMTERLAVWGYPLLAAGLAVGWARVFLGVHFPYDILAALPVAAAGALIARVLRPATIPLALPLLAVHDRWLATLRDRLQFMRRA